MVLAHVKARETQHSPEQRRAWKLRLIKSLLSRGLTHTDIDIAVPVDRLVPPDAPGNNRKILDELRESDQEKHHALLTGFEQLWLEQGMAKGRARVWSQVGPRAGQRAVRLARSKRRSTLCSA